MADKDQTYYKELLRTVWAGISDGTLEHKQNSYFCGTAACIAGWMYSLEFDTEPEEAEIAYVNEEPMPGIENYDDDPWERYEEKLGLTYEQGCNLFGACLTPCDQQKTVDELLGPNAPQHPKA